MRSGSGASTARVRRLRGGRSGGSGGRVRRVDRGRRGSCHQRQSGHHAAAGPDREEEQPLPDPALLCVHRQGLRRARRYRPEREPELLDHQRVPPLRLEPHPQRPVAAAAGLRHGLDVPAASRRVALSSGAAAALGVAQARTGVGASQAQARSQKNPWRYLELIIFPVRIHTYLRF